jgi:hypothetical protein
MIRLHNWLAFLIIGAAIYIIFIMIMLAAHGAPTYPPLGYLASELHIGAGTQLPKGVVYNGRPFFFYIVGGHDHGNGRYTVELQAK